MPPLKIRFNFVRSLVVVGAMVLAILVGFFGQTFGTRTAYAATTTVSSCTDSGLRTAITNAASGGTINFSCSGTIVLTGTLSINKNLTIDGTGQSVTLDGNSNEIFNVNSGVKFALSNLNLTNASATNGGAIYSYGILTVTNANFYSNTVATGGKAAAIYNNGGTLSISNSSFSNNSVGSSGIGGAIYNNTNSAVLSITNSTFSNNTAVKGGAFFNSGGTVTVTNSTFSNNSANASLAQGGAIFNGGGGTTIINSTFVSNTAATGGYGSAIYNNLSSYMTITNSTFNSNSAPSNAGTIYNYSNGTIALYNTLLANNGSGGACKGTITDGGYNLSDDSSCSFSGTGSQSSLTNLNVGSLASNGGSTQTVALQSNSAAIGAAKANCPTTDQRGVSRSASNCDVGAFQSGIIGNSSNPSSSLCTETYLNAALEAGGTIEVYCPASTTITVTTNPDSTSNFRYITNTVTLDASPSVSFTLSGGGTHEVFSVYSNATFTLNNLTLTNGYAVNAGAIYDYGTLTVTNVTFYSNTVTSGNKGGAIYLNGVGNNATLTISNSTFISNSAPNGNGGAIYNNTGTINSINNSSFISNSIGTQGGGGVIDNYSGTIAKISDSTFSNNTNAISNNGTITTISSSVFNNNSSPANTGGAALSNSGTIDTISNVTFSNNILTGTSNGAIGQGGAAIFNYAGIFNNVLDSTFYNNSISGTGAYGGVIDNIGGKFNNISNSTFYSNSVTSGNYGAVIFTDNYSTLVITNSTFSLNPAPAGTATLVQSGGSLTIYNSILANNGTNPTCSGTITDGGYNLSDESSNSCNFLGTSQHNVSNLNLGTIGNYGGSTETIPLLSGSKAISFVATGCPATDQRSVARPATNCDAGAYQSSFTASSLTLTNSPNPSTYGQPVTFTATLSPTAATGTVTFTVGSASVTLTVSSGVATYVTSTLPVGSTVVTATYSGDLSYLSSTSNMLTQTVNLANTNITVSSSTNPSTYGQPVTLTAAIVANTSNSVAHPHTVGDNTVSFTIDGNTVATEVPVTNNIATYVTSTLSAGSHSVVASYTGTATNNASTSATFTQTVSKVTPTINLVISATTITQGQSVAFTATVSSTNGTPSGTVSFYDGATQLGSAVTLSNGTASYSTASLSVGSHSITAVYNGDTNFNSATSSSAAITVNASSSGGTTNNSYTYYLPFVANNASNFTTYLAFQNVGMASANVTITYYDSNGNTLTSSTVVTTVAQYAEVLPANPFASGAKGAGVITSNQPLSVIVPEATPYGGSAYAVGSGSSNSLIAPFALNNAFGDFTTQLNIFNGGDNAATATVTFYGTVGSSTTITSSSTSVSIGAHQTYNLNQNTLPSGFSGWAQISGSASTLVAQVLEQSASTKFVAIANAVANPSSTEYAPAIFNGGYGSFYTGANIVNPNNSVVTVTVTYYDLSANATSATPFEIPAYGVASIFNGATSGNGVPSGGLPSGFIGAVAVSSVGGPVAMSVNENGGVTAAGNSRSGTYAAISSGGSTVGLPVVSNGGYTYITGNTILNTSSQTVAGTITYYNTDGTSAGVSKTFSIAGHGSQAYYQGDGSLTSGFYGTAIITETSGAANALVVTTNAQNIALFYTYSEPNS